MPVKLSAQQSARLTKKPVKGVQKPRTAQKPANEDKAPTFLALWRLLAKGCEEPVAEYRFHPVRRWRFDFCWPDKRIAVEIDGGQFKALGGRHNTDSDRDKMNAAVSLGWRVFRFSPQMLEADPAGCVEMVRKAVENG